MKTLYEKNNVNLHQLSLDGILFISLLSKLEKSHENFLNFNLETYSSMNYQQ